MWLSNAVFVDRANRKSALEQFRKVGETMKRKAVSLFIFAEGTRSATVQPTLLPFKVRDLTLVLFCVVSMPRARSSLSRRPTSCDLFALMICASRLRPDGSAPLRALRPAPAPFCR